MLLGGNNTVVDPRSANEISEARKSASPKQVAKARQYKSDEARAARRERLLNPPMEHVDTISVLHYSSSTPKPATG